MKNRSQIEPYRLYLVGWQESGPLKIGLTGKPMSQRLANLQTACPYELIVFGIRKFVDGNEVYLAEQMIHKELADKRMCGEWFDVSVDEARAAAKRVLGDAGQHATVLPRKLLRKFEKEVERWESNTKKAKAISKSPMACLDDDLNLK